MNIGYFSLKKMQLCVFLWWRSRTSCLSTACRVDININWLYCWLNYMLRLCWMLLVVLLWWLNVALFNSLLIVFYEWEMSERSILFYVTSLHAFLIYRLSTADILDQSLSGKFSVERINIFSFMVLFRIFDRSITKRTMEWIWYAAVAATKATAAKLSMPTVATTRTTTNSRHKTYYTFTWLCPKCAAHQEIGFPLICQSQTTLSFPFHCGLSLFWEKSKLCFYL